MSWKGKCLFMYLNLLLLGFDVYVQYIGVYVWLLSLCVAWTGNTLQGSAFVLSSLKHH